MLNNSIVLVKPALQFDTVSNTDFPALKALIRDIVPLYPNFDSWFNFTFRRNLSSGERKIVIAHDCDQLLGATLLKKSPKEHKICTFYVHPDFRGRGIGDQLMDISLADLDDHSAFITVSEERRAELTPLLNSKGFTLAKSLKGLYRPQSTEHFYTL